MHPDDQFDMQQLFAMAQQVQEQLLRTQQELTDAQVSGTAGGGLVTATVNGQGELVDLSIDPVVIDPSDAAETARTIADLVLAAVRDACGRAGDLQQRTMEPFAAALSGGLPGFPGLSAAPGAADAASASDPQAPPGGVVPGSVEPPEGSGGSGPEGP